MVAQFKFSNLKYRVVVDLLRLMRRLEDNINTNLK